MYCMKTKNVYFFRNTHQTIAMTPPPTLGLINYEELASSVVVGAHWNVLFLFHWITCSL